MWLCSAQLVDTNIKLANTVKLELAKFIGKLLYRYEPTIEALDTLNALLGTLYTSCYILFPSFFLGQS